MAAGEDVRADGAELRRFAVAAAVAAGHDPARVRDWSDADLVHFAAVARARTMPFPE